MAVGGKARVILKRTSWVNEVKIYQLHELLTHIPLSQEDRRDLKVLLEIQDFRRHYLTAGVLLLSMGVFLILLGFATVFGFIAGRVALLAIGVMSLALGFAGKGLFAFFSKGGKEELETNKVLSPEQMEQVNVIVIGNPELQDVLDCWMVDCDELSCLELQMLRGYVYGKKEAVK